MSIYDNMAKDDNVELFKQYVFKWLEDNKKQQRDYGDHTAVHAAANHGSINMLKLFIEDYQIHVDILSNKQERWTPLHFAIFGESFPSAEYLLNKGADPNKRDNKGNSPYHFAIINANVKFLDLLEQKGGDARYKTVQGFNGLQLINDLLKDKKFNTPQMKESKEFLLWIKKY